MAKGNIDNMTIEELVGGASKQEIITYFRNLGNKTQEQEETPAQVINNYNNTTTNNYSTSDRTPRPQNGSDMRHPVSFAERARACFMQLTATDWILIVIALLLFINILVTVKYHD